MKKIVIEVLFPEVSNLYGDLFNVKYLTQCLKENNVEVQVIEDELSKELYLEKENPDFIYMGPMTEHSQELVIRKLQPLRDRMEELIEQNTICLITGNALEIFGERIDCEDGSSITALNLFPTYAKRKMFQRYNSLVLGSYEDMKLVGFKSQFSHSYGQNDDAFFYQVIRGDGLNPGTKLEGLHKKHFFATYALGPLLVLNPDLTEYFLKLLGVANPTLVFGEEARRAYEIRLHEFEDEKTELN